MFPLWQKVLQFEGIFAWMHSSENRLEAKKARRLPPAGKWRAIYVQQKTLALRQGCSGFPRRQETITRTLMVNIFVPARHC
jgi:hypothetical protein